MAKRTPDLSGVRLKLHRAKTHLDCVRSETDAFLERDPAPFGIRTDCTPRPDKSIEYILYSVIREPPPRELALPIGDVIQNIRGALDHLVYELATPRARKSIRLQFPIFLDECEFKVRSSPLIKSIGGDERTLIERVQPYVAWDPPADNPLAILRELSNFDKHKLLVPLVAAPRHSESFITSTNADITFTFYEAGPVEHDAEVLAFTARPQDPTQEMHVNPQSALQIQLAGTGASFADLNAVELLRMLLHHVNDSIINMWFHYGQMPPTWAEVQALRQTPNAT
jgi:hypothetical protein